MWAHSNKNSNHWEHPRIHLHMPNALYHPHKLSQEPMCKQSTKLREFRQCKVKFTLPQFGYSISKTTRLINPIPNKASLESKCVVNCFPIYMKISITVSHCMWISAIFWVGQKKNILSICKTNDTSINKDTERECTNVILYLYQ